MRALAVVLGLLAAAADEAPVVAHPLRWRFGGERVQLPGDEDLWLAHALVDALEPVAALPGLYLGVGGFAAVAGDRGGFFVLGGALGWRHDLIAGFSADLNVFAGGGGGGSAPQGGGLMLRPAAGLAWRCWREIDLRLELARVEFPDGDISSTDLAVGIAVGDRFTVIDPAAAAAPVVDALRRRSRLTATASWWHPDADARRRGGAPLDDDVTLIGVRLDRFLGDRWFVGLTTDGALGGGVAGYMDVLGGLGFAQPLAGPLALEAMLSAGAGGGGDIDTGGGVLLVPRLALTARRGGVGGELSVARVLAPDGGFDATAISLGAAWSGEGLALPPGVDRGRVAGAAGETWRLSALHKTYLPHASAHRVDGSDEASDLELAGIGLEHPVVGPLALTGAGFGAWHGEAGGYAEGLLGARLAWPLGRRVDLDLALAGGAGGGGGVDTGSGLVWQATAGGRVALTGRLALAAEAGVVDAARGSFTATVLALALTWTFDRAVSVSD